MNAEHERLMDEIARCFARAALARHLEELRRQREQPKEEPRAA